MSSAPLARAVVAACAAPTVGGVAALLGRCDASKMSDDGCGAVREWLAEACSREAPSRATKALVRTLKLFPLVVGAGRASVDDGAALPPERVDGHGCRHRVPEPTRSSLFYLPVPGTVPRTTCQTVSDSSTYIDSVCWPPPSRHPFR